MRCSPTIIERLNRKHPGLEKDVCDWMSDYLSGAEISRRLLAKYHETVCVRTVNTYRKIRYQVEQDATRERKRHYTVIAEIVGEKGLDAGAAATLWEALQSMTPRELIAMRRLQLDREQLKVLDKRAENQMQRLKAKLLKPGEAGDAEKKPPDALEIRRRIREIYGLPPETDELLKEKTAREQAFGDGVDTGNASNQSPTEPVEPDESEGEEGESEVRSPESEVR
jgi:hypothetical protein